MGLIGFFITILLMVLGATGYFLFGVSSGTITMENPNINEQITASNKQETGSVTQSEAIENQATDISKRVVEDSQQTAKIIDQLTENKNQETINSQQTTNSEKQSGEEKANEDLKIISKKVDFGFAVSGKSRMIDTVVLHSSYNPEGSDPYSVEKVIAIWKGYEVAPHYMIDRKGNVYRLVDDKDVAYHAGVSKMPDGRTNVNDFSIGVEILNAKDDKYTNAQYDAVNDLMSYLKGKHGIRTILGHADIAPGRKTDPWHFNWKRLK